MASKKAADKGDLFAQFDDVLSKDKGGATKGGKPRAAAPASASKEKEKDAPASDPLADLEGMAKGTSRPHTPRPGSSAAATAATKKAPAGVADLSARQSGESSRGFHAGAGPADDAAPDAADPGAAATKEPEKVEETQQAPAEGGSGGSWWGGFGGLMGAASAAVKQAQSQAEMLAKELQKNEEAQKWAEHMKGNAALLRSYGGDLRQITGELRSRALPGLTNLLHTLAPPISQHERLQVHITHDMVGYPSLDPLVRQVFARVMAQVEGGDLLVLQRGHEARAGGESTAGWSDGPWWRDLTQRRDMGAVAGLAEAAKLSRASAEAYAEELLARRDGGVENTRKTAADSLAHVDPSNPTRSSDIFLAVQAVTQTVQSGLFGSGGNGKNKEKEKESDAPDEPADDGELLFAVYLHDPVHGLAFGSVSQAVPARWVRWLDLDAGLSAEEAAATTGTAADPAAARHLHPDITALVAAGGVDPREWAAEWIEETLALALGVVAQRYVARRMGVGLAAGAAAADPAQLMGSGKAEEAGAGELARAM